MVSSELGAENYKTKLMALKPGDKVSCILRLAFTHVDSVHCTVYTVQCTVYTVQCTPYSVQCTLYGVHYTVYNVQYIFYIL